MHRNWYFKFHVEVIIFGLGNTNFQLLNSIDPALHRSSDQLFFTRNVAADISFVNFKQAGNGIPEENTITSLARLVQAID